MEHSITLNATAYNQYSITECSCGWSSGYIDGKNEMTTYYVISAGVEHIRSMKRQAHKR